MGTGGPSSLCEPGPTHNKDPERLEHLLAARRRKQVEVIFKLSEEQDPPLRLFLGQVAIGHIWRKLTAVRVVIEAAREGTVMSI